ncbi:TssN family type VI secretion system protein [Saccharicrinis aurantiacus]|uniref:TssN family type VI secretion system protein n=1 Tax=Saccharicrinis aurantiacus TaxID=1849719 RepID=UPI00094F524F|nr:TssN family type VI secretion system protein [Saccharicrinis aurantiacus]
MILTYIIYPLLGIILIGLGFLITKKNNMASNKRLFAYLTISILLLAIPGFVGLLDYDFMPFGYFGIACLYLVLGYYNQKIISWVLKEPPSFFIELSIYVFTMAIGAVLFVYIFNYSNELAYGLWASTVLIVFAIPLLYCKSVELFLNIPVEIYNVWCFDKSPDQSNNDTINYDQLKLVKVEIFKQESDEEPIVINAKAPSEMEFGVWFKRLLSDYNIKSPLAAIDVNNKTSDSGWIFYTKPSVFLPRNYIDYNKSFEMNKVHERYTIVAKRVFENIEQ